MLNHIHLIVDSTDVSGFLRDFKKHTSYELMQNMKATEAEVAGLFINEEKEYSIWQQTNMPVMIESEEVFKQKKLYIEMNPVRKAYVEKPEYWKYSSANPNSNLEIIGMNEF